nr:hypothetical protein [Granulicella arctica]
MKHQLPCQEDADNQCQQHQSYSEPTHSGGRSTTSTVFLYVFGEFDPILLSGTLALLSEACFKPVNPDRFLQTHGSYITANNALAEDTPGEIAESPIFQSLNMAQGDLCDRTDRVDRNSASFAFVSQFLPELDHSLAICVRGSLATTLSSS